MKKKIVMRLGATMLVLSMVLACGGLIDPGFEVHGGKVDGACSGLLDYCARARCSVKNLSAKPAPATVTFELHQPNGSTVSGSEYVMLNPKETKTVHHDFQEAKLLDMKSTTVNCAATAAK